MGHEEDRAEIARLQARVSGLERLLKAQQPDAASQSGSLAEALRQAHDQAAILRAIVANTSAATGEAFFRALVTSLASTLGVRCAFVGEVMGSRPGHVRMLAIWTDGGLGDNFDYALAGTPCEHIVMGRRRLVFPRGIRQQFPDDRFLADAGLESYMGFPLFDEKGGVIGLVGVIHDAPMADDSQAQSLLEVYASRVETELRRLRLVEALQENEGKYRLLFSRAMDAVVLIDADTYQLLDVNDVALGLYGYSRDEFLRLRVPDISAEPAKSLATIRQAAETGGAHVQLRWHKKQDGTVFPVEISCGPFTWKGRTMLCGVVRDITERKQAEDTLRERTALFQAILDHSPAMVFLKDTEGRYLLTNRRFTQVFHLAREAVVGKTDAQLFPPEQAAAFIANDRKVLQGGLPLEFEEVALHDDGPHTSIVVKFPLYGADGTLFAIGGITTDVTERRRAEEERKQLAAILETTTDFVGTADRRGRVLFVNRAGRRLLGIGEDKDISRTMISDYHPDWAARLIVAEGLPTAVRDGVWSGETALRTWEGLEIPVSQVILSHKTTEGEIAYFSTIARDLRDRKRLEDQLRQAAKMEAVGRLAGGIAHDFNNILTVINGYSDLLLRRHDLDEEARKQAEKITQAGRRAADLTGQLLAFSRRQVVQPKVLDLNTLVTGLVEMLRRLIGEDIRLVTALSAQPCLVRADPGQIEQVLMNLAVNARDAMPEGGTLTVETAPVAGDVVHRLGRADLAHGPYVQLVVRDTGCGMDADTKAHIFEPFFTTKGQSKSTGLGLAMVYGIVTESGGCVLVDSAPGRGAAFAMHWPQASGPADTGGGDDQPFEAAARGETILLVEDEPVVRDFVHDLLVAWGYGVLTAAGGEEALRRAESHRGPIHLLLTDVVMPGMSGRQLAEQVTIRWPETNILFMSGYTDDVVIRHGLEGLGGRVPPEAVRAHGPPAKDSGRAEQAAEITGLVAAAVRGGAAPRRRPGRSVR